MKNYTDQSTNKANGLQKLRNVTPKRHKLRTATASKCSGKATQILVIDESEPAEILAIKHRVPGQFPIAPNQTVRLERRGH